MPEFVYCDSCGKRLMNDEIALCRKLNGLDTEEYLCLECMAEELDTSVEELLLKIEDFKEGGCLLFEDPFYDLR